MQGLFFFLNCVILILFKDKITRRLVFDELKRTMSIINNNKDKVNKVKGLFPLLRNKNVVEVVEVKEPQQSAKPAKKPAKALPTFVPAVPPAKPAFFIDVSKVAEFNEFVEEAGREKDAWQDFYKLIPNIHKSAVFWKIKKQFNNDPVAYVRKHKLFIEKFTQEMKDFSDKKVELRGNEKRNNKKKQKEYLLYASQLLGLVGKNGSSYLNDSLVKHFQDDMREQEEYFKNLRLVDVSGKIKAITSLETKQKRKIAQILNIAACLDQIAKDRTEAGDEYTYNLITLTLPACYHPSPAKGKNSFNGVMPLAAHGQLHKYWRLIRANMAKAGLRAGKHFFGMQTVESHKDSTLHLHCVLFFPKRIIKGDEVVDGQELIESIVAGVANRSTQEVKFDISKNNGKAGAATYIFKYITKTNAVYSDTTAMKNTALRWYYSARGFNFFGIDSAVSKFNFVVHNREKYEKFFCDDLNMCLKSFDYYNFITKYSKFFKSVRHDSKIDFVVYNLDGNEEGNFSKKKYAELFSQRIIIKRTVYNIFEKNENVTDEVKNVHSLNKDDFANASIFHALDVVKDNNVKYRLRVSDYKALHSGIEFISKIEQVKHADVDDMKAYCVFEDLEYFDEECQSVWKNHAASLVSLIPSHSSGDPSPSLENQKTDVYSPRLSEKVNQKIKNLIDERRKIKGLVVQA
ncbi:replication endonuclease [Burkholderia cepacia]|uniref:replication endonuclease n=1 Tax=Burkholderia cepacia TaxID=292 RepID=UPI001CF1C4B9|nr:replication endonuclease [Burkholderia cepacia]MCA8355514.1 replication endonuclease [Burkholderia cepacia]